MAEQPPLTCCVVGLLPTCDSFTWRHPWWQPCGVALGLGLQQSGWLRNQLGEPLILSYDIGYDGIPNIGYKFIPNIISYDLGHGTQSCDTRYNIICFCLGIFMHRVTFLTSYVISWYVSHHDDDVHDNINSHIIFSVEFSVQVFNPPCSVYW